MEFIFVKVQNLFTTTIEIYPGTLNILKPGQFMVFMDPDTYGKYNNFNKVSELLSITTVHKSFHPLHKSLTLPIVGLT